MENTGEAAGAANPQDSISALLLFDFLLCTIYDAYYFVSLIRMDHRP